MKKTILYLFILMPFFSFSQTLDSLTLNKLCLKDFWRYYDISVRDTLSVLNSHSLCIKELPVEFYKLTQLKSIIIGTGMDFEILSNKISIFKDLEVLIIHKSKLSFLPKEIGVLRKLKKLSIAWGGQLAEIPKEIGNLSMLEYLDLYRNKLTSLPETIANLKNLKTLRLGDNNFSALEKQRIKKLLPNCEVTF